jgi:uncharacterized ferritin-like protein (DUF455 family)
MDAIETTFDLHAAALACLTERAPDEKCRLARDFARHVRDGALPATESPGPVPIAPGRPERPRLVAPRALSQRGLGTREGRAAFVHAIAHIEFNAINLACDAAWRFRDMPAQFYRDWAEVADDEARHFQLLQSRLATLGFAYGDFDAHNGLWEMAERTADSCLARMALVPRVLEARGLDVTPAMIARLQAVGDRETADILELILREEVAHVAAGTRWFRWCCERESLDPHATFDALLRSRAPGAVRAPFNLEARRAAGFDDVEMRALDRIAGSAA